MNYFFFINLQRSASTLPGAAILNVAQCKLGTDNVSWLLRFKSSCLVYIVYIFVTRFSFLSFIEKMQILPSGIS